MASQIQAPVFINGNDLGTVRANDVKYLPVSANDVNPYVGLPLYYSTATLLPVGMRLDTVNGYVYGKIPAQSDYLRSYSFSINATKSNLNLIDGTSTFTTTNAFSLLVKGGDLSDISWKTASFLGTITQNSISSLSVVATATVQNYVLQYREVGISTNLPAGLTLTTAGNIVGVVTDTGIFTTTIMASTSSYSNDLLLSGPVYPYSFSTRTFTFNVEPATVEYTNIYVKPLLSREKRIEYNNFITDQIIFDPMLIYRADDINFGVQTDLKMVLVHGIQKLNLSDYKTALITNIYKKRLFFGDVKVAKAKDSSGNHIYDTIYIDMIDPLDHANSSVTVNGHTYYPASVNNMRKNLSQLGSVPFDENRLPLFMRTPQAGSYIANGYIKALVLCYTLPGQSANILTQIRLSKFDFKMIDFEFDRIIVDDTLDYTSNKYVLFGVNTDNTKIILNDGDYIWNFDDGVILTYE
jgi:hypothetical protein